MFNSNSHVNLVPARNNSKCYVCRYKLQFMGIRHKENRAQKVINFEMVIPVCYEAAYQHKPVLQ